ncbi:MAG: ISL3 family transposase [Spirochaetales bacterium]|nr:ISL3 family transposase [Spirochaetales bacterium]
MSESLEEFYSNLLGIESPWKVASIDRDSANKKVIAIVKIKEGVPFFCPVCGKEVKKYDQRIRRWRHLDSCNHKTILEGAIPRIKCPEHGVKQIPVKWAEENSRFTLEFESAVILWLKDDPISTVAANFGLSWASVDGIMSRAVKRGLAKRKITTPRNIGIDETSFRKRHEYVTVILDKDSDSIIDVLDDRKAETLKNWFKVQQKSDFSKVESISMDMWDPFINAVKSNFVEAESLISFDRFHVAQHFGRALDKVRAQEHRILSEQGISPLLRTKHQWLKNSNRTDNRTISRKEFMSLSRMNLKTARAWRIKEAAATLWNYRYMGVAEKAWKRLLYWISHCRLKPMISVGKMIRKYFWGILNAIRLKSNNSMLEAKNARIQRIKKVACGFRNKERFKNAILFHLGGLELMPSSTR